MVKSGKKASLRRVYTRILDSVGQSVLPISIHFSGFIPSGELSEDYVSGHTLQTNESIWTSCGQSCCEWLVFFIMITKNSDHPERGWAREINWSKKKAYTCLTYIYQHGSGPSPIQSTNWSGQSGEQRQCGEQHSDCFNCSGFPRLVELAKNKHFSKLLHIKKNLYVSFKSTEAHWLTSNENFALPKFVFCFCQKLSGLMMSATQISAGKNSCSVFSRGLISSHLEPRMSMMTVKPRLQTSSLTGETQGSRDVNDRREERDGGGSKERDAENPNREMTLSYRSLSGCYMRTTIGGLNVFPHIWLSAAEQNQPQIKNNSSPSLSCILQAQTLWTQVCGGEMHNFPHFL